MSFIGFNPVCNTKVNASLLDQQKTEELKCVYSAKPTEGCTQRLIEADHSIIFIRLISSSTRCFRLFPLYGDYPETRTAKRMCHKGRKYEIRFGLFHTCFEMCYLDNAFHIREQLYYNNGHQEVVTSVH